MGNVKIVLADDHPIFRDALRTVLESQSDMEVVGEASTGVELLHIARRVPFDIVCLDIRMPAMTGTEAIGDLLSLNPSAKVIGVSALTDRDQISEFLKAGAHGYVTKGAGCDELLRAIDTVRLNRRYLCQEIADLDQGIRVRSGEPGSACVRISSRETEVLRGVAEGLTSLQIAEALGIAASTVEVHRRNIMKKLGLSSIAQLTKYAVRKGLVASK